MGGYIAGVQLLDSRWFKSLANPAECQSIREQDTEPQITPDEQLVPWMARDTCCWHAPHMDILCKAERDVNTTIILIYNSVSRFQSQSEDLI